MLLQGLLFLVGLVVLYFGAEWLIKGAASLALALGVRPLIVGLTVVALGTSMPEFIVNVTAAITGEDALALGNIIGSNISNIALILGATALVIPLKVGRDMLKREYPMMLAAMFIFFGLALDGSIGFVDGLLLVGGLAAFLIFLIVDARRRTAKEALEEVKSVEEVESGTSTLHKVALILLGMIALAFGARLMVSAAVFIAESLGVSSIVIGLTVVAIGTSLPEMAASVVGALRAEPDLAVGNIIGSNLLNVLFVIGFVSLVQPLKVETSSLQIHFPIMLAFTIMLFPIMLTHYKISRFEGGLLLASFVGYLALVLFPYM